MTMPALNFDVNPSMNGTEISVTPRVLTTTFGDGYKQSSPDGLNFFPLNPSLVWASLDNTDANYLISFFEDYAGQTFTYQLPNESFTRKFQCVSFKYAFLAGNVMTVSAQFEERFDQAT